jgi:hypothetical protein
MWIAKIQYLCRNALIGRKAFEYGIDIFGFPISFTKERKQIIVHIAGTLFGENINKKKLTKNIKKEKRILNFEVNNDFFVGTIKEPRFGIVLYNKDIIHVEPVFISKEGFGILTIGAFNRDALIKVINTLEKKYKGKLIFIQQRKIKSISIMKIKPELTEKQRKAMELAIQKGYYHSPRKIDMQQLAKLSGLSFSTFQVHLRKAEAKLIPYSFE